MTGISNESSVIRGRQNPMSSMIYQQDDIELAGNTVDRHIQLDNSFPKLIDQLQISHPNYQSVSGLSESDYPSHFIEELSHISQVSKVPLPNELVEQFRHMQCNCMMGLFTDISRAWLTIDSDIFVWTYEDGGDLAYFDGLSETILSVGLVKPKKGIFQSHIQYLLCLTTPVEIILLGVSFKAPDGIEYTDAEMHLLPDPLFSLPTDNCHIVTIQGTENGRIFMGGKDGCLYELVYQAEDGWFSRRCRKVNHSSSTLSFLVPGFLNNAFSENDPLSQIKIDESRQILYSRSEKGTIQVYDLDDNGTGMSRVAAVSQHTIVQNAVSIARTIDRSNFYPIVHIDSIEVSESNLVNLVAVTKSGVRLYFTATSLTSSAVTGRPRCLNLIHVRLPPGFSSNSPPQRPRNVHKAFCNQGTTLLIASQAGDTDMLWTLSNDSFPFQQIVMEDQVTICLDGHTWTLSEIPSLKFTSRNYVEPPAIVTQHETAAKKFVFLSSQGSQIIMKHRPVDQLRKLLEDNHGADGEAIKSFFALYGDAQACATCLILACSPSAVNTNVREWATRAFLMYGNRTKVSDSGFSTSSVPATTIPFTPGFSSFSTHAGLHPQQMSTPQPGYNPHQVQTTTTTGRHQGLYLYFSRIVRNFWNVPLVFESLMPTSQGNITYLSSNILIDDLGMYIEKLKNLKEFLDKNLRVTLSTDGMYGESRLSTTSRIEDSRMRQSLNETEIQEKKSLVQLQHLIARTCEVLGLWKVIADHQLHVLISSLTKDQQSQLRSTIFRDFIVSNFELATILVNKVVSQYLDDNSTTDAISSRLRDVCPSIYRTEDVDYSKAFEKIISSKKTTNRQEKEELLRDSLQLCKRITPHLNLTAITAQFRSVHFYDGIVDLCLTASTNKDPQNLALHYYKSGEPVDDQQGMHLFASRMDIYKIITETLGYLLDRSASHPQSPSVPKQPGPPPAADPNMLSPQLASQYAEQVFQLALNSNDEVFHVALYDWLIEMKFTERLLQIKSPYLEAYLKRQSDNFETLDLLWQYYEKNKCFSVAAKILNKLSDRHSTVVDLQTRLEYLSRAVICIKSSEMRTLASNEGEFLHELEEKMEVARIQLMIVNTLQKQSLTSVTMQEAIGRLNADLYDISQLYEQFAEPYGLPECQLAILHCAGHQDSSLIESLWQKIIDNEFTATAGSLAETRIMTVSNKLKTLGKTYISSSRYLPLPFLVKYLEKKSCNYDLGSDWVLTTMQSIGIPVTTLLQTYDKLYKLNDPCWQVDKKPLHLLQVLLLLIEKFVEIPSIIPSSDRRLFCTMCLDAVANYLVDLQSLSGSEPNVTKSLIPSFKSLQTKLQQRPF